MVNVPTVETSPAPQFDPEERADLLMRHLGARREGLAAREAERRLAQFGPNVIERRETASAFSSAIRSANFAAGSSARRTSSTPLSSRANSTPAAASKARRRGEVEARMSLGAAIVWNTLK